jgi:hypothetical protein
MGSSGLLEGAADEVAGAEADGEREGEDDAAEEDSEGEFDDHAADFEVVEDHGGGEDENQPLDAEGEKARVLQVQVDGTDEHGAGEEAGDDGPGEQDEDCADGVGEVRDEDGSKLRVAGVGGVEGGDADDAAEDDAGPEDGAGDEGGGRVIRRPVGDVGGLAAGEALVELGGGEDAAEDKGEQRADQGEDGHGDEQSEQAGEETDQLDEHAVHGISECGCYLLTHEELLGFEVLGSRY